MSAAKIPGPLVPPARTDADWAFNIGFRDEDWRGSAITVVFARQGQGPSQAFLATIGDGLLEPAEDLAVAIRLPVETLRDKAPGVWSVQVNRVAGGIVDDAAVFNLRLIKGLTDVLLGGGPAAPAEGDDGVAPGGVIIARAGSVEVVRAGGREGDPGPPGQDGVAVRYVHAQASAAAEWIVNHNLGARPAVTVLSVGGVEVEAQIVHASDNQVRVLFAAPFAGSALCL